MNIMVSHPKPDLWQLWYPPKQKGDVPIVVISLDERKQKWHVQEKGWRKLEVVDHGYFDRVPGGKGDKQEIAQAIRQVLNSLNLPPEVIQELQAWVKQITKPVVAGAVGYQPALAL